MIKVCSKKVSIIFGSLLLVLLLSGCDNAKYKERIQQENDFKNPNGNKYLCLRVGDLTQNMYPYTIHYMEGYNQNLHYRDPIFVNYELNQRLALFAQEGVFSQELVGYDGEQPLYRYDLTDEGRLYISERNSDRFCFGRVVVTTIKYEKKQDGQSLFKYGYYLENVPNWAKDERLDKINRQIKLLLEMTPETDEKPGWAWFGSNNQLTSRTFIGSWIY